MKAHLATLGLLLAVTSGAALSATGEPPQGFRDKQWGSTSTSGLKKVIGPSSDGTSTYTLLNGKSPLPLLQIPINEEGYGYIKGKFYSGDAFFDGKDNFNKVKAALTKAYGNPDFTNGVSQWQWKWPNKSVEVRLSFQAKHQRGTISYQHKGI
jgi:hypothetical protein